MKKKKPLEPKLCLDIFVCVCLFVCLFVPPNKKIDSFSTKNGVIYIYISIYAKFIFPHERMKEHTFSLSLYICFMSFFIW